MTRKKVKLAFIANDSSRKTTFRKRKNGLMKKLNEITTLCDIPACAILYSPYDVDPVVWPSSSGVQNVVAEFRSMPEIDQQKKMVDQETFLRQRIEKVTELLKRQRRENREREMTEVMFHCLIGSMGTFNLNLMDLNDLGFLIDQFRKDVKHSLEIMKNSGMEIGQSSNAAPADAESANEAIGTITVVPASTAPTAMVSEAGSSSSSAAAAATKTRTNNNGLRRC
ncbi:unnamed protein product [Arabis nemorensis]|uniref:MADS-box domain-containing protein n=1 Tax=Arabis nemorensis TaxID=586526 RepID=A0A565BS25_9BRAS|nr:unnamed protein product [Arabis nemorensis]